MSYSSTSSSQKLKSKTRAVQKYNILEASASQQNCFVTQEPRFKCNIPCLTLLLANFWEGKSR